MEVERLGIRAQHSNHLVVHDLDDHVAGRDGLHDRLADRLGLHLLGKILDDFERHIGLEQGAAHLAHGLTDVAVRQRTAFGELVEDAG